MNVSSLLPKTFVSYQVRKCIILYLRSNVFFRTGTTTLKNAQLGQPHVEHTRAENRSHKRDARLDAATIPVQNANLKAELKLARIAMNQ